MDLGRMIDGAIAPWAPAWAERRMASRARMMATAVGMDQLRHYDAAARDRRNAGWKRVSSTQDGENSVSREMLANAGHDLVRNNKYAAAAVRQMVATIVGDGIAPQAVHPVKHIQRRAQDEIDRFAESKVDGFGDWYGHQKVSVREMVVGGEALTQWLPDDDGPDGRIVGLEGPYLDASKTQQLDKGRIVQGVQFDQSHNRTAYWLFDQHPNDIGGIGSFVSKPVAAENIDHLFERLRFTQARGVSFMSAVAMSLRDIGDIEDAKRLQEKIQACVGLIISPPEGGTGSPLSEQSLPKGDNGKKPLIEKLSPGMILRLRPGETSTTLNPTPSSTTVEFIRQQLAGISANMVPYHLMTGDVSQANYSGLRAAMNGSYSLIDDWQQNEVIPLLCRPAVHRRMRRLALQTGERRYLDVKWNWALPVRRMVDPIKDLMGEIMEIRAGLKLISTGLAERGINAEEHLRKLADLNALIDDLGLALDTDPRRLTDSGILQTAAGVIAPKGDAAKD
ncbi:phage portal protein [Sphingomonas sp. YL-JM2C]